MPTAIFPTSESQVNASAARSHKGPNWVRNAVFYQIYPQTFSDSNGDGIGDLNGIRNRLPYLKSLGIDCVWLSPFYVSPFRDAGYDVADYYTVAPRYGTNEDARRLFAEAHAQGLRIIIDLVPGHTSQDHPWFKASCEPQPNKYSNWYIWTDGTWFEGMDQYSSQFVQGYCDRDGNFMTNFFVHQPALNFGWGEPDPKQPWQLPVDHPDILELRKEMIRIMRFWLDMGCDGFRVDMAGSLVKKDKNGRIAEFWGQARELLDKEYPEAFIISEWSHPASAIAAGFHADFLHWVPNYNDLFQLERKRNRFANGHSFFDKEGKGNITRFLEMYEGHYSKTKESGYISLPVGNHDLIRIRNQGRDEQDLQIIHAFLLTMPGLPFIYYGDEIAMRQLENVAPKEGAYGTRAGARTPMQWDSGPNLGFSSAAPQHLYFPVDSSGDAPTVAAQDSDPDSFLNFMRGMIALRRNEPALAADADFEPLYAVENEYPFAYKRVAKDSEILVLLNPADKAATARFSNPIPIDWVLISGSGVRLGATTASMEPRSYSILKRVP